MTLPTIVPGILCGGLGSRRQPVSRKRHPRQCALQSRNKSPRRLKAKQLALAAKGEAPLCMVAEDLPFAVPNNLRAEGLENTQLPQATMHRRVARPSYWYDSIDMGERFQVKRIGVKPGASLNLQKHPRRAEHWIVVQGTAEVTNGDKVYLPSENQSTYIPIGEVQSGSYLGEDDILRIEDNVLFYSIQSTTRHDLKSTPPVHRH